MQNELIAKAVEMFDTPEKWEAFIELSSNIEEIKAEMVKDFRNELYSYFHGMYDNWCFEPYQSFGGFFYLKNIDQIQIGYDDDYEIWFFINLGIYDNDKVCKILDEKKQFFGSLQK